MIYKQPSDYPHRWNRAHVEHVLDTGGPTVRMVISGFNPVEGAEDFLKSESFKLLFRAFAWIVWFVWTHFRLDEEGARGLVAGITEAIETAVEPPKRKWGHYDRL